MIDFLIEAGVVAGLTTGAGFVGNILGYTRGRTEKNLVALFTTGQAENLWCLCEHPMSFHDKGTGMCHHIAALDAKTLKGLKSDERDAMRRAMRCQCRAFVGDPSKNPPPVTLRKPQPGSTDLDLG